MSSREDILGRVRERLGRTGQSAAAAQPDMQAWMAAHRQQGPRTPFSESPLERFRAQSLAMSSTVDAVASPSDAPAAAARYLRENNLPLTAVCAPQLANMKWAEAGIAVEARGARDTDLVGITGCFCAVADTGTLMMCSDQATPAAVSLLPETHIAVVPARRIVAYMEDAWELLRTELDDLPRAVNFISGPSRTADIEQTLVLGAHGPYRVHLIIVGS